MYVIDPDGTVTVRPIKVAQISDGQALDRLRALRPTSRSSSTVSTSCRPAAHVTILHGKAADEAAAQSAQQTLIP